MGGDYGHPVIIPAVLLALNEDKQLRVLLVGDKETLLAALSVNGAQLDNRLEIVHAPEIIAMDEAPSQALRNKKRSSMRVAIELVRDGNAHGCVSAGNTGALMAISWYVLKTIESIERPAILARIPRADGCTFLVDAGANIDSHSERLHQFALMGSAAATVLSQAVRPKIALLNVGIEENKGNDRVKLANELLRADERINYIGYVEGSDIFSDKADVVVCDGFVGNIVIKTSEGMARFLVQQFQVTAGLNWKGRLIAWLLKPWLKGIWKKLDPGHYNGASLVGIKGVVVKSHGAASDREFLRAIKLAADEVHRDLPSAIERLLA